MNSLSPSATLIKKATGLKLFGRYDSTLVTLLSGLIITSASSFAQSAAAETTPPENEPVTLSPFEVKASDDVGYQGSNTLNGSRLNTRLKDLGVPITVFTKEFLSDFGATSIEDMTAYAPNLQLDTQDRTPAATPTFMGGSNVTESRIRVRGLPAGTAFDFFETLIPIDNYRVDRFELASGPNSILFGFANPGGLVTSTTKKADTSRTQSSVSAEFGSWDRQRYELDHNQVLIPHRLSFRLYGVKDDGDSWRKWDFKKMNAGTASIRFDPWKNTKITANYENGQILSHVTRPWNAQDSISLWTTSGSPVKDANAFVTATDRSLGLSRTTTQSYIYVGGPGNAASPFVFGISNNNNFRVLESQYEDLGVPTVNQAGFTLLSPKLLPYDFSSYGPGSTRDVNFNRTLVRIEQKLGDHGTLELAYNREETTGYVLTPQGTSVTLYGDPNATLPNPNGSSTPIANPNAGKLYMSTPWGTDYGTYSNEVFRATLGWELNLGRILGNHSLSALVEHGELEQWRYPTAEILVDENNIPIANSAAPENAANRLTRRQYVTPGDFSTYYGGDARTPISTTINGKTYHSTFVNTDLSGADVDRSINSFMLATQSRFFSNRLIVTAGARIDDLTFKLHGGGRLTADDPRVISKQKILNEFVFSDAITSTVKIKPHTETLGGVFHLTSFLSVFANFGSNVSQPTFNAVNLITRQLNPPSQGKSHDYGLMVTLLEDKVYLRVTSFETSRKNWDSIVLNSAPFDISNPINSVVAALLQNGKMTQDEATAHNLSGSTRFLHDIDSRGLEASLSANLSKNWTLLVNFSKTNSAYTKINLELDDWFVGESAFLLGRAGSQATSIITSRGNSIQQELAAIPQVISDGRDYYAFAFGERPYKANASGRYTVTDGFMKGLFIGGGVRWQSRPKNGRYIIGRQPSGNAIYGDAFYGPEDFKADSFIGYNKKFRVLDHKTDLTIQFNVRNLTDEDEVMPLRLNNNFSALSRTALFEPRSFRLTTSLNF